LTATRVLSFWSKKLRLDWDLPLTLVQGVQTEATGILFVHKQGPGMNKFVLIPDKKSQTWFFGEVAAVVRTFNQQRRMDS
jgi:vacuolar protein sorting-associated protein 13A/C